MSLKIFTICALFGVSFAGLVPGSAQYISGPALIQQAAPLAVAQPYLRKSIEEYDPNPQYSFAYGVQDSITGDSKNQQETRNGDVVRGQYSLTDPDGTRRTVDYTADSINGFNAVVSRTPLGGSIVKAEAAPLAYASQPILKALPFSYAPQQIIKSTPLAIPSQQILQPAPFAYASQPLIKTAPFSYASQPLIKTAPLSTQTIIRSY